MPNVRSLIQLTEDEIRSFIESSKTVTMATLNHDGVPHLAPMWYSIFDGLIHMHTYQRSQKVVNIQRDPRGSALIEDGEDYDKLRGVFMRGHFEVIDDQALCLKIGLASAEKYMNVDVTAAEPFVREQVKKRVALIFQPEKISSWDHRKMKS